MTIGERIHARRKELNLTMQAIFERENIKTGNLSELEHDKYLPSVQTLIALGRVLQCSIDWLLTGAEYKNCFPDFLDIDSLKSEQGLTCDHNPLKDDEADLIAMFRLLPSHEREDLFDLVYFKYQKHVEKKKESIYSLYTRSASGTTGGLADDDNTQGGIA